MTCSTVLKEDYKTLQSGQGRDVAFCPYRDVYSEETASKMRKKYGRVSILFFGN